MSKKVMPSGAFLQNLLPTSEEADEEDFKKVGKRKNFEEVEEDGKDESEFEFSSRSLNLELFAARKEE